MQPTEACENCRDSNAFMAVEAGKVEVSRVEKLLSGAEKQPRNLEFRTRDQLKRGHDDITWFGI